MKHTIFKHKYIVLLFTLLLTHISCGDDDDDIFIDDINILNPANKLLV